MKKLCSLIAVLCFAALPAVAAETVVADAKISNGGDAGDGGGASKIGYWVETQVGRSGGKGEAQVVAIASAPLTGRLGLFILAQAISDGYRQAYAGPSLKLGPVEVGVGIGSENMPDSFRRAAYAFGDIGKISFVLAYEDGGSGPWHTTKVTYKVTDKVGVGAMEQSFFGFGPRVEYDLAKGIQLWGAVARERHSDGKVNGKVGLAFTF